MRFLLILTFCLFTSYVSFSQASKRQMRAVWVATVTNIDWPSQKGLTSKQQQDEMIRMLDDFKANNINTVIFQARPAADVFYASCIEPWCMWLSGKQGIAPNPYYDPLKFIIEESHKRCMEVHVWINPYRALNYEDVSLFSKDHIFNKKRYMFVKYGDKYYFDPGVPDTRDYLNSVLRELVENYDMDAIHFDDYFYPYPIARNKFPDDDSFSKYHRGFTHRNDWRRDNVTLTIRQLHETIKSIKPWVDFGVSPFGVWRHQGQDPRGSKTYRALTNYDDLYADILKWMREGYIDYVAPQLYWEIGKKNTDYRVLVDWWTKNAGKCNVYAGLYVSGFEQYKNSAWRTPNELVRQMQYNKTNPLVKGEMFFSARTFMKNLQGLNDELKQNFYAKPALVPENQNLKSEPSAQPKKLSIDDENDKVIMNWEKVEDKAGKAVSYYVVYAFKGKGVGDMEDANNIVGVTAENNFDLSNYCSRCLGTYSFVVTSVNKFRRESSVKSYVVKKF